MAFPVGARTTGELITASVWNADLKDNLNTLRAGGIAIASQAALDFIYGSSATQLARLAKGTALQYPRINAAANGWEFATLPASSLQFLQSTTNTTTSAAGQNLATVTFTGANALTATDAILAVFNWRSTTQQTANVRLFNSTDNTDIFSGGTAAVGNYYGGSQWIQRVTDSNTVAFAETPGVAFSTARSTFAVAGGYTNSWGISLRHDGVTPGGTLYYTVTFYRVAGQA